MFAVIAFVFLKNRFDHEFNHIQKSAPLPHPCKSSLPVSFKTSFCIIYQKFSSPPVQRGDVQICIWFKIAKRHSNMLKIALKKI